MQATQRQITKAVQRQLRRALTILELWGTNLITDVEAKKPQKSSREITTALFLLRCLEVGLSLSDLDLLTIGMVLDIWTEKGNDGEKYETRAVVREANQHDFDVF